MNRAFVVRLAKAIALGALVLAAAFALAFKVGTTLITAWLGFEFASVFLDRVTYAGIVAFSVVVVAVVAGHSPAWRPNQTRREYPTRISYAGKVLIAASAIGIASGSFMLARSFGLFD